MTIKYFIHMAAWYEQSTHFFDTKEELEAKAAGLLHDFHCEDGWDEEVEQAIAGWGEGIKTYEEFVGDDDDLTEPEYSDYLEQFKKYQVEQEITDSQEKAKAEGREWEYSSDWDYICRYDIVEIKPSEKATA